MHPSRPSDDPIKIARYDVQAITRVGMFLQRAALAEHHADRGHKKAELETLRYAQSPAQTPRRKRKNR
jgi:hypothetical protein